MTTRTISSADIAALQAARSIIADAAGHPAQRAAIEAIDRLGEAPGCAECERRKQADEAFLRAVNGALTGIATSSKIDEMRGAVERLASVDTIAERVRLLYGFDTLDIGRDPQRKCCEIMALRRGTVYSATVIDHDVIESPLPSSPWFAAFRELALRSGVEDVSSKDVALAELLSPGAF